MHLHLRPPSVKILLGYLVFLFLFYAFHFVYELFTAPTTILFGKIFTGSAALFVDGIVVLLLACVIYGLLKRAKWAWPLAIIWFILSILSAIFSLFFLKSGLPFAVRDVVTLSFIAVLLIDGFVLWYMFYRRNYFEHKTTVYDSVDKFFVYVLVSFWIIVVLALLFFGINYYRQTTQNIDSTLSELDGADFETAISICASKEDIDKDICYTLVSALFPDKNKQEICSKTSTDFYRITCMNVV